MAEPPESREPARSTGWRYAAVAVGVAVLAISAAATSGALGSSPTGLLLRRTERTTTRHAGIGARIAELALGAPEAAVSEALGAPDRALEDGPLRCWQYDELDRTEHSVRLLALLPVSHGSRESSQTHELWFRDGALVYSAPTRADASPEVAWQVARTHARLDGRAYAVASGPYTGRDVDDQLRQVMLGQTTAPELRVLLGAPQSVQRSGSLEVWQFLFRASAAGSASLRVASVYLADGVVVATPHGALDDGGVLRRFAGHPRWPTAEDGR